MKLWQLLAGVPLTGEPYSQNMEITSISYDTRTLLPGALFVALSAALVYAASVLTANANRQLLEQEAAQQPELPTRAEALAHIQVLCRAYYPQFAATCPGGAMPKIAVRDMNTRWGSCSLRTGTLAFARRLCTMPLPAQEYVVVHEFCHFAHPDHSPAFWAAVAEVLPDYKQRERMLKLR